MISILSYVLISLTVFVLASLRFYKKKIKLFSFLILAICAFIPQINAALLASYVLWVIILDGDKQIQR